MKGESAEEKYIDPTVSFIQSHLDFLLTNAVQHNPPFKRTTRSYSIEGRALPAEVAEKARSV